MTTRALVLGGGGIGGIAWEVGALQGLRDGGVDTARWDLVVGTSAGSFVGARLLSPDGLDALLPSPTAEFRGLDEAVVRPIAGEGFAQAMRVGRWRGLGWVPVLWFPGLIATALVRIAARQGVGEARRVVRTLRRPGSGPEASRTLMTAIGTLARHSRRRGRQAWLDFWVATLAPVTGWPATRFLVTVIDTANGAREAFDAAGEASIVEAVAASTCLPGLCSPVAIGGRRYMDGGLASPANVDLASGFDHVVVVVPFTTASLEPAVAALRASGSQVTLISPSPAGARAIGPGAAALDPGRRTAAARAGYADGLAAAAGLRPSS